LVSRIIMLADGRPDDPSVTFPFSFPVCAKDNPVKRMSDM
jgi:hypothetical protein